MKNQKTIVSLQDGTVCRCDTITFEGRKWLVADCRDSAAATGRPDIVQTILMEGLAYRPAIADYGADYILDARIPMSVWRGEYVDDPRFTVVSRPRKTLGIIPGRVFVTLD